MSKKMLFILLLYTTLSQAGSGEVYTGNIDNFINQNPNLAQKSTQLIFKNPFDGKQMNGFINPKKIPKAFLETNELLKNPTSGSYWSNDKNELGDYFRLDTDGFEELELIDELSPAIYDGRIFSQISNSFLKNEDIAFQAIAMKGKYDSIFTIYHELAHTQRVANNREISYVLSLSKIRKHGFEVMDKNHREIYISIRESIADLSATIYMLNHGIIDKTEINLFLTGLMIDRANASSYIDNSGGKITRIKGDDTHNTVPSLSYFFDLIQETPGLVSNITDKEIIRYSLRIIKKALSI